MPIRAPRMWLGATPIEACLDRHRGGWSRTAPSSPPLRGSLPASSPSRKGVERRFKAVGDPFADRLATGLSDIAAQGWDAVIAGRQPPSGSGRVFGDGPCRAAPCGARNVVAGVRGKPPGQRFS